MLPIQLQAALRRGVSLPHGLAYGLALIVGILVGLVTNSPLVAAAVAGLGAIFALVFLARAR